MRGTCTIENCTATVVARGYCCKHYQRWKMHGDPTKTTRLPPGSHSTCTVSGCGRKHASSGYCWLHYGRVLLHGKVGPPSTTMADDGAPLAFIEAALKSRSDECILYPYAKANGYGRLWFNGKNEGAHRLVCFFRHGDPPTDKHEAAHECGVRACVNPAHLSWKTGSENNRDKVRHGTATVGVTNPHARLSDADIVEIRRLRECGLSQRKIAARYGVSRENIRSILRGWTWSHVGGAQ